MPFLPSHSPSETAFIISPIHNLFKEHDVFLLASLYTSYFNELYLLFLEFSVRFYNIATPEPSLWRSGNISAALVGKIRPNHH